MPRYSYCFFCSIVLLILCVDGKKRYEDADDSNTWQNSVQTRKSGGKHVPKIFNSSKEVLRARDTEEFNDNSGSNRFPKLRDGKKRGQKKLPPLNLRSKNSNRNANITFDTEFLNPYNLINDMELIAEKFPNVNMTTKILGRTAEYKDIVLVMMSDTCCPKRAHLRTGESKFVEEEPEKEIIFIVIGLDVSGIAEVPCLSQYEGFIQFIEFIVNHVLKGFNVYLIPVANPDGFVRSASATKWNKNNSPQDDCPGVALDHNFDVEWDTKQGSSCRHTYGGPSPFSEPETKAIREILHAHGHKMVAFINAHAGTPNSFIFKGDAVLYPKGYVETTSDDDRYIDIKGEVDEAMKNASFKLVSVKMTTLYDWYGKTTGTSVDYASTVYGIPYAMEFVMQPYTAPFNGLAFTEIWKRVMFVIFENIYRKVTHANDADLRRK